MFARAEGEYLKKKNCFKRFIIIIIIIIIIRCNFSPSSYWWRRVFWVLPAECQ